MSPRHALAICELSALAPRQEVTHSAAKVVVPKIIPLLMQRNDFACAWLDRFSGASNRFSALRLAFSLACGFENCFMVSCRANSLASAQENCLDAACRSFSLTSGRRIISRWFCLCLSKYAGSLKRFIAFSLIDLPDCLSSKVRRCFSFCSSVIRYPEDPSPPSVRLQSPWSLYRRINSRSSSKAHHSCIPCCTISTV